MKISQVNWIYHCSHENPRYMCNIYINKTFAIWDDVVSALSILNETWSKWSKEQIGPNIEPILDANADIEPFCILYTTPSHAAGTVVD